MGKETIFILCTSPLARQNAQNLDPCPGQKLARPGSGVSTLLVWNFHLGITAGCDRIHCRHNAINVAMHGGPLRIAKYHDGNSSSFEILLILDVFVCR
jgi:hypothetical protein